METQTDPVLSAESTVPDNGPRPKRVRPAKAPAARVAFKVGDEVAWESQAGGFTKRKIGKVIEVVPPETCPLYNDEFKTKRDHESYVVKTGSTAYWPLVSKLEARGGGNKAAAEPAKKKVAKKVKASAKKAVKKTNKKVKAATKKTSKKASKAPKVKKRKAAEKPWYLTGAKPQRELVMTPKLDAVLKAFGGKGKKKTLGELTTKAWKFKGAKASSWTRNQLRTLRFHKLVKRVGEAEYKRV